MGVTLSVLLCVSSVARHFPDLDTVHSSRFRSYLAHMWSIVTDVVTSAVSHVVVSHASVVNLV